jgi:Ca2+-binding EF-hand superfamily protein
VKFRFRTSTVQRSPRPRASVMFVLCASSLTMWLVSGRAEEPSRSVSVPVTNLSSGSKMENPRMAMPAYSPQEDQPTLPDGKLPQYQLTPRHLNVESEEEIGDSRVRFFLALPKGPILIEAIITIDGEPFRRKREQRVQAALQAALQPPMVTETPTEIETSQKTPSGELVAAEESPLRAEKPGNPVAEISPNAYQSASSIDEKLRRYVSSIGREPSLPEVRWFFIQRLDGPTLLLLKDSFQSFRADQTPIFHLLDRNRDGVISATEIGQSVESFLDCDLNRNEIVDYLEINEAANDPRLRKDLRIGTGPLLVLLPASEEDASETYAELLTNYVNSQQNESSLPPQFDSNSNGQWEPEELNTLRTMPADLTLNINFDSADGSKSSVTLPENSIAALDEQQLPFTVVNSSIVITRQDCDLWISAIQSGTSDQISLGAVNDGYPMLPVLDPNDDGKFTLRELRGLGKSLAQFDRNQDGQILKDELRPTIRVAFGMGPHVHQALAGIRNVNPFTKPAVAGPEWFVRMDRNKDGDLTRKEFPGTDEQFTQLNADGDEFVSAEEALDYDRKTNPNPPQTETPTTSEAGDKKLDEKSTNNNK